MPSVRSVLALAALAFAILAGPAQAAGTYKVDGVRTQAQRSAVARSGAAIVQVKTHVFHNDAGTPDVGYALNPGRDVTFAIHNGQIDSVARSL